MKSMRKILSLVLALIMVCSLAACGGKEGAAAPETSKPDSNAPATAPADDTVYEWKLASIFANPETSSDFNGNGVVQDLFVKYVNERSNGRIVVTPYYDSVLGGSLEQFEQVQRGELEMALLQPMSSYDPRFGAYSIPYLFKDIDEVQALAGEPDGPIYKLSEEWFADHGMVFLGAGCAQFRGIFNTKHEVTTIDTIRDLKLRTYQDALVSAFWEDICIAVPLAFSDVYTSLQTKAIDGLEFSAQNTYVYKYPEMGGYYTDINWQWCSATNLIINADVFNALPTDLQELVRECAYDALSQYAVLEKEGNEQVYKRMEEEFGVQVTLLTDEQRATWEEYAKSKEAEYRDFIGAEVYDEVVAIVEEYRNSQK